MLICVCVAYEPQVDKPAPSPQTTLSLPQKYANLPCRASSLSQQAFYQPQIPTYRHERTLHLSHGGTSYLSQVDSPPLQQRAPFLTQETSLPHGFSQPWSPQYQFVRTSSQSHGACALVQGDSSTPTDLPNTTSSLFQGASQVASPEHHRAPLQLQGASRLPQGASPLSQGASPPPQGGFPLPQGAFPVPQGASPLLMGAYCLPQGAYRPPKGAYRPPQGASPLLPQGASLRPLGASHRASQLPSCLPQGDSPLPQTFTLPLSKSSSLLQKNSPLSHGVRGYYQLQGNISLPHESLSLSQGSSLSSQLSYPVLEEVVPLSSFPPDISYTPQHQSQITFPQHKDPSNPLQESLALSHVDQVHFKV